LWVTGYDYHKLESFIAGNGTIKVFFDGADLYQKVNMIKGLVCSYRIEEIPDEFALYRN
jgi:hypothetical protein